MRSILVFLHRYLGLATALFLFLAGVTGSILVFNHELDEWLNPQFYTSSSEGEALPLTKLAERFREDHPRLELIYIESEGEAGHPALAVGEPKSPSAAGDDDYNWAYLDPVTGDTVATRYWARCCFEAENFIPFIYEFHHTLMLPETWGLLLMGIVAIVWLFDHFIALWLTFPKGTPFMQKWKKAWRIKSGASAYRTNVDVHRAGGLWLWLLLLLIAMSSIAMNLPDRVFKPVVSLVSPVEPSVFFERSQMSAEQLGKVQLDFADIIPIATQHAATINLNEPLHGIFFSKAFNYYAVGFGDEHESLLGSAWLFFDGEQGRMIRSTIPGEGSAGEIFYQLQLPIHSGSIAGLPGRITILLAGLLIAVLSVTGVVIWWKKRKARVASNRTANSYRDAVVRTGS